MTPAHAAALAVAYSLRLLPRRLRWPFLLRASAVAAPILRAVGVEPGMGIDGFREIALWRLMVAAGEAGLAFDPVLEHCGQPPLDGAGRLRAGMLVAGPHSLLNYLAVRHLHNRGGDPVVVAADPSLPVFGTRTVPRAVPASLTLLPQAARHFRAGDVVCAMIDWPEAAKGTFRVDTALGPIHVAEPLLKLAVAADAEIVFCAIRIAGGKVLASWEAPPRPADIDTLRSAFAAFLEARIAEGLGRGGPRDLARARVRARPSA